MKFVIIGAGDTGSALSANLTAHQHEVSLIEKDPERIHKDIAALDIRVIIGNGADPDVLSEAGLDTADYLIAVTDSDEVNIAACFISRLVSPAPKRIARLREIDLASRHVPPELLHEYFDLIINPDQAAADYLMQLLKIPGAREIVEFEGGKLRILGITVGANSALINVKLENLKNWQNEMPLLIVAVMRGAKMIVPKGDDKIRAGDVIYAVTTPEKTKLLFELAGRDLHQGKSAIIWGSSGLARTLARSLEEQGTQVKVLVAGPEEAEKLGNELKSTLILQGEGTDQALLISEHIADTDAFIAVTPDDENNILASLLAKKLGAGSTMALITKSTYLAIVSAIGVDVVVSPRLAAAQAIYRQLHSRAIIHESSLQHEGAGFIEIDASAAPELTGRALKDLKLPHGILVAGIIRESQVIIPTGEDTIDPHDRVVMFLVKSAIRKFEKMTDLKLELFA